MPEVIERVGANWEMDDDACRLSFVQLVLSFLVTLVYNRSLPYEFGDKSRKEEEMKREEKGEDEIKKLSVFLELRIRSFVS
jgi:hypothetical protein